MITYLSIEVPNRYLIPHTHNDLGWRKTIKDYYYD